METGAMAATPTDDHQALMALGMASQEVAVEEKQAAGALARVLGHNQVADDARTVGLEANIVRKLGNWKAEDVDQADPGLASGDIELSTP